MNLKAFCMEEDASWTISRVMVHEHWRYATDARIAVRVPATPFLHRPRADDKFPPKIAEWFDGKDFSLCTTPFPSTPTETFQTADECDCIQSCMKCQGEQSGCKTCRGTGITGKPDCKLCNGTGWRTFDIPFDLQFGLKILAGPLIKRINEHLSNVLCYTDEDPKTPLLFVADGGVQGVLAPMRSSDHLAGGTS